MNKLLTSSCTVIFLVLIRWRSEARCFSFSGTCCFDRTCCFDLQEEERDRRRHTVKV